VEPIEEPESTNSTSEGECSVNQYLLDGKCHSCSYKTQGCSTCEIAFESDENGNLDVSKPYVSCLTCYNDYIYDDGTNTCAKCSIVHSSNCDICTQDECLSCNFGFYEEGRHCLRCEEKYGETCLNCNYNVCLNYKEEITETDYTSSLVDDNVNNQKQCLESQYLNELKECHYCDNSMFGCESCELNRTDDMQNLNEKDKDINLGNFVCHKCK
jgi:hypothetical protein